MSNLSLRRKLLRWYDASRRRLPWREQPSPYKTWISEIMLQQTQVKTVLPYYERFLRRFPNVKSLAKATEDEVLRRWAGLGYYSRGRNLHKAAKAMMAEHRGSLPTEIGSLRRLPGNGDYTAAAIGSIAFGKRQPLVDGNVARVFSRLFGIRGDVKSPRTMARFWAIAGTLMKGCRRPGDWNQALMELGALVCLPSPKGARCGECPLSTSCEAFKHGLQDKLPEAGASLPPIRLDWTALLVRRGKHVLLWRRAADERFLPNHWGLPEARHLPSAKVGERIKTINHSITHHRIRVDVREASLGGGVSPPQARWIEARRAASFLYSSLWRKAIAKNRR